MQRTDRHLGWSQQWFDSAAGDMDDGFRIDIDVRAITDHYAGEEGYYDWRETAYKHPRFLGLFLDELRADKKLRTHLRRAETSASVYFIQQGTDGPVKIGATRNIEKRIKTLQTGSHIPLTVLGVVPGGFELESDLHQELMDYQLEGEWFSPTPEVMAVVKRHIDRA